jgi:hypothetical protein
MIGLEGLANVVSAVQTEPNSDTLSELFKTNAEQAHDIITICCPSARSSIKPHHVVKILSNSYGLFPEEYSALMEEQEMPMLLASESAPEVNKSLSLREVIELKQMILRGEIHADILFNSMSKIAAVLFWGFCFGRRALGYRRIMRSISSLTNYDTHHLQTMRTIMPTGDIIQRALMKTLPDKYTIQPSYPFLAPTFSRWNRWSVPFKQTHYDIVRGERYYAHRLAGGLHCYDRHAARVTRAPIIEGDFDCVCEMDESGNIIEWLHTNDNPNLWEEHRTKRATHPKELRDRAHLRAVVESLEAGQVLRLMDAERGHFHSGAVGGFIVPRRTFDLPLLILGGFREGEGIRIKIAALDGFDVFPLGYAFVRADDIPDKLARLYDAQGMMDIDEGLIGIFHALNYDHDKKTLRAPYLTQIDTTLGQSDAIQIGDLIERGEERGD